MLVQLDGLERGFVRRCPVQAEALAPDTLQKITRENVVILIVVGDEDP
jgi:hypothetical protein